MKYPKNVAPHHPCWLTVDQKKKKTGLIYISLCFRRVRGSESVGVQRDSGDVEESLLPGNRRREEFVAQCYCSKTLTNTYNNKGMLCFTSRLPFLSSTLWMQRFNQKAGPQQLCLPLSSSLVLTMGHYNIVCNWLDTGSPLLNTHMHCCSNTWCWFCKKRGGLLLVRAVSGPLRAPLCPLGAPVSQRGVSQQSVCCQCIPSAASVCSSISSVKSTNFSPGGKNVPNITFWLDQNCFPWGWG